MHFFNRVARKAKKILAPTTETRIVNRLPECNDRLAHVKSLGFDPDVVFDCGAFIGRWAKDVNQLFPTSKLVLIEPNSELYPQIADHTTGFESQTTLIKAAVGESAGTMNLNIWENPKHTKKTTALAASSLLEHVQGEATRSVAVNVITIDEIAQQTGLKPNLLKLDLQGAELPALKGAAQVLESCELCIIEFGCLDAYKERTTPAELVSFMYERDYALYDIVDVRYRPFDGAMMGGDFFFVKRGSQLKAHRDYF
jgi:FkbM family methyltransferase